MGFVVSQRNRNARVDQFFYIGRPGHVTSTDKKPLALEQMGEGAHARSADPHKVNSTHILQ